ncbi:thioesterase [Diaphorobacter aerolatus]|uniref:Thioesterase n=1 Tax=Diaphorobacter aerolatus TaxID=1288495 RepID=A0A7H0GQQ4_9BURK|nr:thioesterase [Diaphorobacter aerolatus]
MHDAPVTLLCLPCAGASATMYLRWRRYLPHWIHLAPIELPGRGARMVEAPVEDFAALVAGICDEQSHRMPGEFVLFGHSMGALLAYGVATRLRANGKALPRALLLSGCAAPSARDVDHLAGMHTDASLVSDLRRQGGTPDAVFEHDELLRLTLDLLRADYRVCSSFVAPQVGAVLPLPVHVFAGRNDAIGAPAMKAWSKATSGAFTLDWFDGGHFFIRDDERAFIAALVRRIESSAIGVGTTPSASLRESTGRAPVRAQYP